MTAYNYLLIFKHFIFLQIIVYTGEQGQTGYGTVSLFGLPELLKLVHLISPFCDSYFTNFTYSLPVARLLFIHYR